MSNTETKLMIDTLIRCDKFFRKVLPHFNWRMNRALDEQAIQLLMELPSDVAHTLRRVNRGVNC